MALSTLLLEIKAGEALSAPLEIPVNLRIVRIGTPDAWDSAQLTFQISPNNVDWRDLYHAVRSSEGPWSPFEVAIFSVPPSSILLLPPDAGFNVGWIKFRSGTRAKPVAQQGLRKFAVVFG